MVPKIKAGLSGISVNDFILKVRYFITVIVAGGNFPNLPHPVAEIEADTDILAELQGKVVAGNRINIGSRNEQKNLLKRKMTANAAYVNSIAMGNPSLLETSGFEMAKPPIPHAVPGAVFKLVCKPTNPTDSVKLAWKAEKVRDYYTIQMRIGATGTWAEVGTSTKPTFTVPHLPGKQEVFFRVAAVNAAGKGLWSNVQMFIVA